MFNFNVYQVKQMAQKNNKWNISREKGEKYAHQYIIEILKGSKNNTTPLSELIILLNQRTKHIKLTNNSRIKPFSVYLRCIYGNIINFMDKFNFYGVIKNNDDIHIKLFETALYSNLDNAIFNDRMFNEYNEWILIETEEFVLI